VLSLAFSPNGEILASGSANPDLNLWNVSDGSLLKTLDHFSGSGVYCLDFSSNDQLLASGTDAGYFADSSEGTVFLWKIPIIGK